MATLLKLNDLKTAAEVLGQMPDLVNNRTTHIFIPVNNDSITDHDYESSFPTKSDGRPDSDQASRRPVGTHWSLLVVSLIDNVAFHYDSIAGLNEYDAGATLKGLGKALPTPRALRIVNMQDSPQQTDGSNCGIFTIVIMKHLLLKRLLRADASQKITMSTLAWVRCSIHLKVHQQGTLVSKSNRADSASHSRYERSENRL
jgi:sentrin-specific protease 8